MKYLRFALAWAILFGCGGDSKTRQQDMSPSTPGMEDAGPPPVASAPGTVKGRVTYADGTAIGQVNVRICGKVARSDSRGVFEAKSVPAGDCAVSVQDNAASAAQVNVKVEPEKTTQVDLAVLPMRAVAAADVQKAGTFRDSTSGVTVTVNVADDSFKEASGQPASGKGEMRYGVVTQSVDVRAAPGGMKVAMDEGTGQLESFG